MEAKTKERREARKLRRVGWSISRIIDKVNASKGSISAWIRDIKLTDSQKTKLMKDRATAWGKTWRGLANASLRKGTVVKPRKKTQRMKKLKYGVCTVQVNKTEIIQSIYGAIQEYGGFQDDRWLDAHS